MKKNMKNRMKVPFYAHILSRQELELTSAGSKAYATSKSPSDKDETAAWLDSVSSPAQPGSPA